MGKLIKFETYFPTNSGRVSLKLTQINSKKKKIITLYLDLVDRIS